ncbi:MAG TPA: glycosyltransferase family A protein [Chitinophagaceae bacterium]|nr:glycosyltransferase family A protein [Chitinophagaceae bacterium]
MDDVKVTVLMPARNAEKYIAEAMRSVLEQDFTDFEFLILNDGSTDDTANIIKQFGDRRIRLIEQPGQGIAITLNKGLQEARGRYIARFDADDICFPGRLQKQVKFLDENMDHVLTGCDAEYISENGEHLFNFSCTGHSHQEIMNKLYVNCPFIHSGVMYRKEMVLKAGGYSPDAHNFEDYLLWIQLAKYGRYSNLPEQLIKVRFNPNSATIDEKWRGHRFRKLKRNIIRRGIITKEEGEELQAIIKNQDGQKFKEGAYYALCGKKFLLDNHQPAKARSHLAKAIRHYPLRFDNYVLYMLSYFPGSFINWLNRKKLN